MENGSRRNGSQKGMSDDNRQSVTSPPAQWNPKGGEFIVTSYVTDDYDGFDEPQEGGKKIVVTSERERKKNSVLASELMQWVISKSKTRALDDVGKILDEISTPEGQAEFIEQLLSVDVSDERLATVRAQDW